MSRLPKGIWLEANRPNGRRDRYRVRLYKNHIVYHAGYYYELEQAIHALVRLRARLITLPAERRNNQVTEIEVPEGTLVGMTRAIAERRQIDPRTARVRQE